MDYTESKNTNRMSPKAVYVRDSGCVLVKIASVFALISDSTSHQKERNNFKTKLLFNDIQ